MAEDVLDGVIIYSREQFSFQMCFESGDSSGIYGNWRLLVRDSWCMMLKAFDWKLILVGGKAEYKTETLCVSIRVNE